MIPNRTDRAKQGWPRERGIAPTFLCSKNKKGKQRKKKKVSKQELLKGCHQGQNVTILVMFTVLF